MTDQTTTATQPGRPPRGGVSVPSERGPDATALRRPSADPTLGDGSKPRTTLGWLHTPTLTDRRALEGPVFVVDDAQEVGGTGSRIVDGLTRLERPAELISSRGIGGAAGRPTQTTSQPSVVHICPVTDATAPHVRRTIQTYRPGATITYHPAPDRAGAAEAERARLETVAAHADVVTTRAGDLEWLYPGEDPRTVAARWLAAGTGVVIVTTADAGSWAMNTVGTVATVPATVELEPDGVGEAFTAGVIDALAKGGLLGVAARADLHTLVSWSLQELLENATAAAAIAHRSGGRAPTRGELAAERGIPQLTTRPAGQA